MQRKHLNFVQVVDIDLIESRLNNGFQYLIIFDDSCEKISNSKQFVKIATAGSHIGLDTIYIKHNLGSYVKLHNTHIVLCKSTRGVLGINTVSQHLFLMVIYLLI